MVSLALLLLTVSTLATQGNAFPKELRRCEGSALCYLKPIGQPQEEMDRTVLEHLPRLQRIKRFVGDWVPSVAKKTGNCRIRTREIPLFNREKAKDLPQVVLQSKWFNQTQTEVQCAEVTEPSTRGCLSSYTKKTLTTQCETKYMHYELVTYNLTSKEFVPSVIRLGVDCACVLTPGTYP